MVARRAAAKKLNKASTEEFQKRVAQKAYDLWQKRGCVHGEDWNDWFTAEKTVKAGK